MHGLDASLARRRAGGALRLDCVSLDASRRRQAASDASKTVWVKRMDVQGAQYGDFAEVDLQMSVSAFKARYVAQAKLDVDPSLVTLRLVLCGSRKPTAEVEAAAVELDDPSLSLGESGVTGTAWLLVDTVQLARLATERAEEAERQRAEREEEAERQRAERRARRGAQHYPASSS